MGGLVQPLVMIDAERISALPHGSASPGSLRREEARRNRRHDHEGTQVVEVRDIRAEREARDLGVMPVNGKGDGRIAQDTEVEGVVGVLPNVVSTEYEVLPRRLLEARMELIAEPRL